MVVVGVAVVIVVVVVVVVVVGLEPVPMANTLMSHPPPQLWELSPAHGMLQFPSEVFLLWSRLLPQKH